MSESSEGPTGRLPEANVRDNARLGSKLFGEAAARYGRSGTTQAAYIARQCLELRNQGENVSAAQFGRELLDRKDLLTHIIRMANNAHAGIERERRDAIEAMDIPKWKKIMKRLMMPPGPPAVDMGWAEGTIEKIFTIADSMSVLNEGELEVLLKEYPRTIADERIDVNHERVAEVALYQQAQFMIDSHTKPAEG